eukprot:1178025-Prorocentrum_minimum.AAC.2
MAGLERASASYPSLEEEEEESYPALTGGWSGRPDGQLGFPGNPAAMWATTGVKIATRSHRLVSACCIFR